MHKYDSSCKLLESDATEKALTAERVSRLQDRFTSLVPALTKYGATTVGVTLLVIGLAGLYETLTEGAKLADEAQPALAGEYYPDYVLLAAAASHRSFLVPVASCCVLMHQLVARSDAHTSMQGSARAGAGPVRSGVCQGHVQVLVCPIRQQECPAAAWLQQSPE